MSGASRDGSDLTRSTIGRIEAPADRRGTAGSLGAALVALLRDWWRRERERRELAAMRGSDFGDLTVPPALIGEELRRWPWQKTSRQWGTVTSPVASGDGLEETASRGQRRGVVVLDPSASTPRLARVQVRSGAWNL